MTKKGLEERDRTVARYERKVLSSYLTKETKKAKSVHYYARSAWVVACDIGFAIKRKMVRLARSRVE